MIIKEATVPLLVVACFTLMEILEISPIKFGQSVQNIRGSVRVDQVH